MDNQDEIKEFSRMLDLLPMGRNVPIKSDLDPKLVRIVCTLAANDLSGLSRQREALRRRLGQHRAARDGRRSRPRGSLLASFSMGFATVIALAYVGLVLILPLAHQRTGRDPSMADVSTKETTLNALLAAVQRLASPTALFSPTPTLSEEPPAALPTWSATQPSEDTEVPPAPTPTWTPALSMTPTPQSTFTSTPTFPSTWAPPEYVDYVFNVSGDAGTAQQFNASLPSESGATRHIIQIIVNIPPAEGNAGRRRVDYTVTCTGAEMDKIRWGWWGWPPYALTCGTVTTSDGLLWSHNVVYLVVEAPADTTTALPYTITVTVGEYSW